MLSKRQSIFPLLLVLSLLLQLPTAGLYAAPTAPSQPDNVACRPNEGKVDQVRVEWKDTNDGTVDYKVYRKNVNDNSWGSALATVTDGSKNGTWKYVDSKADGDPDQNIVYQYRVTAVDGDTETAPGADQTCREPIYLDADPDGNPNTDDGTYRMFYRLQECPEYDGKAACTENIQVNGQNKHVAQMLQTSEAYRAKLMAMGFNDPGNFTDVDKFPLDFFPCNNGCANGDGIQYPPGNFVGTDYDPNTGGGEDYEVFVGGHEIFHKAQGALGGGKGDPFYKWLIEGQARMSEDKVCIFNPSQCITWDNVPEKYYLGQIESYLGKPEYGLQKQSYNAALFWLYVAEQFAGVTSEPEYGMDVLLKFWQKNLENKNGGGLKDGIQTLNDALSDPALFTTDRRFKDIFEDFAVANYAKDYLANPVAADMKKYNYIDDEQGLDFGKVKLSAQTTITTGTSLLSTSSVNAWGARYFEFDVDPSVSVVNFQVNPLPGTPHSLYYHLLGIDNNQIVDQWSSEGSSLDLSIPNLTPVYDRLVLIVAGLEKHVLFDYSVNLSDGVFILSPNAQFPDAVGDANSPGKFITWLRVMDVNNQPVAGIDPNDFTISVGNTVIHPVGNGGEDALISSFYSADRYMLALRAPANPGCTACPLTVSYGGNSDSEPNAILYGPPVSVDNMIVIDRSGSMEGAKIEAAKGAAKVYVDSYETGDRIGVISYNSTPTSEYTLHGWSNTTRQQAQNEIETLAAPAGDTATGAALREGMKQLIDQASPNPAWAMVLLSDGKDTVEDTDQHIPKFIGEYDKRVDNGLDVPTIHVVAVGDDADGPALQQVSDISGGEFQYLPESGGVMAADTVATGDIALQLDLAEIYRVFAEEVVDEQQIYAQQNAITNATSKTHNILVEGSAGQLVVVVKYVYTDFGIPISPKLTRPDNTVVGAPTLTGGSGKSFHWIWRIPAPAAGTWKLQISPVIPGLAAAEVTSPSDPNDTVDPNAPGASRTDYLVEAALVSNLTLDAFLGLSPAERLLGKAMPIRALLADNVPVPGATVTATVKRTGEVVKLFDDGKHDDGVAKDGVYAGLIKNTFSAGGYQVLVEASGTAPLAGAFQRRARLSFFLSAAPSRDQDLLPDWWEDGWACMNSSVYDHDKDYDLDGLNNLQEFQNHTNPCDPDTDDGGEQDGSEVTRAVNPLNPEDDFSRPPVGQSWPGVGKVTLKLATSPLAPKMDIYRAATASGPFQLIASDVQGDQYEDNGLPNGREVCYQVVAKGRGSTAPSDITCATPQADPYPPHGEVFLPVGVLEPVLSKTKLLLQGFDNPYTDEHPAFDGELVTQNAEESGVVEMQLSSRADFEGAQWVPYSLFYDYDFQATASGLYTVFVRYKDAAGNISDTAARTVQVDATASQSQKVYLPLVTR
ncbi:MAG: VWA domain-containing protein [Caldilineaceae bacterium]